MKKRIMLFLILTLAGVSIHAQNAQGLSMLIEDSVKILKGMNDEVIANRKAPVLKSDRRLKFDIVLTNKSKFKSLFLYFVPEVSKWDCPEYSNPDDSMQVSKTIIYQNASANNKDSGHYQKIWGNPIHTDTNSDFSSDDIWYSSNSLLLGKVGFSYIIEDDSGQIVNKNLAVSHVNYNDQGFRKFQREFNRSLIKEKEHSDKYIHSCLKSKKILKRRTVKTRVLFRKISKTPPFSDGYPFLSGITYYITFYYTFFLDDNFANQHLPQASFIYGAINNDLKSSDIERSHVFQGQIRSNRVRLIVK